MKTKIPVNGGFKSAVQSTTSSLETFENIAQLFDLNELSQSIQAMLYSRDHIEINGVSNGLDNRFSSLISDAFAVEADMARADSLYSGVVMANSYTANSDVVSGMQVLLNSRGLVVLTSSQVEKLKRYSQLARQQIKIIIGQEVPVANLCELMNSIATGDFIPAINKINKQYGLYGNARQQAHGSIISQVIPTLTRIRKLFNQTGIVVDGRNNFLIENCMINPDNIKNIITNQTNIVVSLEKNKKPGIDLCDEQKIATLTEAIDPRLTELFSDLQITDAQEQQTWLRNNMSGDEVHLRKVLKPTIEPELLNQEDATACQTAIQAIIDILDREKVPSTKRATVTDYIFMRRLAGEPTARDIPAKTLTDREGNLTLTSATLAEINAPLIRIQSILATHLNAISGKLKTGPLRNPEGQNTLIKDLVKRVISSQVISSEERKSVADLFNQRVQEQHTLTNKVYTNITGIRTQIKNFLGNELQIDTIKEKQLTNDCITAPNEIKKTLSQANVIALASPPSPETKNIRGSEIVKPEAFSALINSSYNGSASTATASQNNTILKNLLSVFGISLSPAQHQHLLAAWRNPRNENKTLVQIIADNQPAPPVILTPENQQRLGKLTPASMERLMASAPEGISYIDGDTVVAGIITTRISTTRISDKQQTTLHIAIKHGTNQGVAQTKKDNTARELNKAAALTEEDRVAICDYIRT